MLMNAGVLAESYETLNQLISQVTSNQYVFYLLSY